MPGEVSIVRSVWSNPGAGPLVPFRVVLWGSLGGPQGRRERSEPTEEEQQDRQRHDSSVVHSGSPTRSFQRGRLVARVHGQLNDPDEAVRPGP